MHEAGRRSGSDNPNLPSTDDRTRGFSQSIDWYHEGESRVVESEGVRIEVRFVGRKGRQGRIAIVAPAGATFRDLGIRPQK